MSLVVRIVAPTGRDAELTKSFLRENDIAAEACSDLVCLLEEDKDDSIGALVITEEAIDAATRGALIDALRRQPPWSDLPILIFTGTNRSVSKSSVDRFSELGSPVVLERPLRPETLLSSVRAALRSRQRQYEMRDTLSARDAAEAALKKEQDTLRVVIDSLPVGVVVAGRDGGVVIANRNAEEIFGKSLPLPTSSSPWRIWEAFHLDGQALERHQYPLWRAIRSAEAIPPTDYLYRGADHEMRWVRIAAAPILDSTGAVSGAVATLSDIDREKRAEVALIKSEKLAAVGRLAASIAHEINNPLEAVTNLLYLVEQNSRDTDVSQFAVKAQEELARVSQIVTQTLRFHRQSSSPQLISVRDLLESTLALYRARAANLNIGLELQCRGDLRIYCRDGDVRQVLNNLIGNAIDALREGGRLILRANTVHDPKATVSGVRVTIADTGHGIPPETMKHVFEPFYTTKGNNGTGLGLWISQEIIARSKGRLRIRSRAARHAGGTVASIFLPARIDF